MGNLATSRAAAPTIPPPRAAEATGRERDGNVEKEQIDDIESEDSESESENEEGVDDEKEEVEGQIVRRQRADDELQDPLIYPGLYAPSGIDMLSILVGEQRFRLSYHDQDHIRLDAVRRSHICRSHVSSVALSLPIRAF